MMMPAGSQWVYQQAPAYLPGTNGPGGGYSACMAPYTGPPGGGYPQQQQHQRDGPPPSAPGLPSAPVKRAVAAEPDSAPTAAASAQPNKLKSKARATSSAAAKVALLRSTRGGMASAAAAAASASAPAAAAAADAAPPPQPPTMYGGMQGGAMMVPPLAMPQFPFGFGPQFVPQFGVPYNGGCGGYYAGGEGYAQPPPQQQQQAGGGPPEGTVALWASAKIAKIEKRDAGGKSVRVVPWIRGHSSEAKDYLAAFTDHGVIIPFVSFYGELTTLADRFGNSKTAKIIFSFDGMVEVIQAVAQSVHRPLEGGGAMAAASVAGGRKRLHLATPTPPESHARGHESHARGLDQGGRRCAPSVCSAACALPRQAGDVLVQGCEGQGDRVPDALLLVSRKYHFVKDLYINIY